jgi:hypothetical protein
MLFKEIFATYSENHLKRISTLCEEAELLILKQAVCIVAINP